MGIGLRDRGIPVFTRAQAIPNSPSVFSVRATKAFFHITRGSLAIRQVERIQAGWWGEQAGM